MSRTRTKRATRALSVVILAPSSRVHRTLKSVLQLCRDGLSKTARSSKSSPGAPRDGMTGDWTHLGFVAGIPDHGETMTDTAASDRVKIEPREDSSSRVLKVVSPAYHIRKHYLRHSRLSAHLLFPRISYFMETRSY